MDIKGRKIGPEHPPLVIAEIGINHGGDLNVAQAIGSGCRTGRMRNCEAPNPFRRRRNDPRSQTDYSHLMPKYLSGKLWKTAPCRNRTKWR